MIYVGNSKIEEHKDEEYGRWFYVGRPDVLGNIYSSKKSKFADSILVDTPEIAVENYRKWLWDKIKNKDVQVLNKLSLIKEEAINGNITLLCWCVDKHRKGTCHAHVIKSALEWMINQSVVEGV